jgi:hypothetical protein
MPVGLHSPALADKRSAHYLARMGSPFREQRIPPAEVRRILRRALELGDAADLPAEALTQAELERHAAALGISRSHLELAAGEAPPPPRFAGGFWGAPSLLALDDEVAGELHERHHEDVVEAIRERTRDTGQVNVLGGTLRWSATPSSNDQQRRLSVTVRSRGGATRIRVEEQLRPVLAMVWIAVGLFPGVGIAVLAAAVIWSTSKSLGPTVSAVAAVLFATMLVCRGLAWIIGRRKLRDLVELRARLRSVVLATLDRPRSRVHVDALDAEDESLVEEDEGPGRRELTKKDPAA